jgi:deoxyribonuclease-1
MYRFFLLPLLIAFSTSSFALEALSIKGNRNISSFSEAKKTLHKIHQDHQITLYCGCKYYGKEVNMNSCNSSTAGQSSRFKKLEWEHVVPADKFGEVVASWSQGDAICKGKKGRKCASKASALFRQMEGDMYNLWPESGGINAARSNKPPVESLREPASSEFGKCETKVGKKSFSPRPSVRGEIARAYLYMNYAYEIPLSKSEFETFQKWNQQDPADSWECERGERIKKLQGNVNPILEASCKG